MAYRGKLNEDVFATNSEREKTDRRIGLMSEEEIALADRLLEWYRSAWMDKENRGLFEKWETIDLYWEGDANQPESENDPASNVNIVNPNIEGQVAYLIEQNISVQTKGRGPSDQPFADIGRVILEFVKERNKMRRKLDVHERRRLKFGTGIFRVLFDPDKLDGMGMPVIDVCNPAYVFPDPNVTDIYKIQEGRFLIEVMNKSISWARESGLYPEDRVNAIEPGFEPMQTTLVFGEEDGESDEISRDHYLHMLVWFRDKDEKTGEWKMRLVEMSGCGIILRDTKDDPNFVIPGNIFPYFFTPDMYREGTVWGKSTAELLIPLQDLINDLDDQIRLNARLTGNPQRWFSTASGIDPEKWTNDGGLILPTDMDGTHPGLGYLTPPSIPDYIFRRRDQAFSVERQVVTRFGDQQTGVKQQGVDTATEALALQQGANAGVQHRKILLEETLSQVFEYVLELCMEYWTEEMAFRVSEREDAFRFFRPSDLREIPVLIPSTSAYQRNFMMQLQAMGFQAEGAPAYQPLIDSETGEPVTKKVELDITITVGAGLPSNKAFVYTVIKENVKLLPPALYLRLLREYVGLPISDSDIAAVVSGVNPTSADIQLGPGSIPNPLIQGLTPQGNPMRPENNPALERVG